MSVDRGMSLQSLRRAILDSGRFLATVVRLRSYLKPHLPRLLIAGFAAAGYAVVTLLEPWPIQVLFDGVLLGRHVRFLGMPVTAGAGPLPLLLVCVGLVVLFAALRGQLYYVQNVLTATAGQDVVMALRRRLFQHLQTLSLAYHRRERLGDILMRLTGDIVMLREMIVAALISVFSQLLVLIGTLCIMGLINFKLTLVAVAVMPLLFITLSLYRGRLIDAAAQQRRREGALVASAHEVLQSIHLVQANTAEGYEDERFREKNKRSQRAGIRSTRLEAQLHRAVQVTIALGVGATLGFGAADVLAGRLSPGQLLVFLAYVRGLYNPLRQISKVVQRTAKASACADRVLAVLEEKPEITSLPDAPELRDVQGRITIQDVTFGYDLAEPVLRQVHLEIEPGSTVALVGPTGAGKTTLLNLIPRFHDPQIGDVLMDGVSVRAVSLRSLRRQISYLSQEAVVMGVTVRENIAYGAIGRRSAPTQDEIERAANAAHAHEFIVQLPQGYDTVVSERGTTLSGGQRQRIAIARALLRDARVLLLDEPMTGLDPVSERAVREAFISLTRNRTAVVVAHQLSTVLHADRIVFLDRGRIVEQGTHEGLLARGGPYARFYRTQWGDAAADQLGSAPRRFASDFTG